MKRNFKWPVLALAFLLTGTFGLFAAAQTITITVDKQDQKDEKPADEDAKKAPFAGDRPSVEVAILLDTSNSMDGLIDQAKNQLWKIVQQFAAAEKRGQTPLLRIAVFEYGNTNLPASEGYIRQVVQLTDDLDEVSEALFALTTNGGDEYCGTVINEALKRLDWSSEPNAFKTIFIAGNEPFTQGSVDYQDACKKAIESGVVVNTIHCGDYQTGVSGKWKAGAELAEGKYLNIDQDRKVVHIKCPQDKIIIELNKELNKTYLWYGKAPQRAKYHMNQSAQDDNAYAGGGSSGLSERAGAKSGAAYRNVGRDLVDTFEADKDLIASLKSEDLPESLQELSVEERTQTIQKMAQKRAEIKKKMAQLNVERQKHVDAETAKIAADSGEAADADTFGSVIQEAVSDQMKASGFEFKQ